MNSTDLDLFLSHSSVDKEWVERLARRVEAVTLHGRNLRVFLDSWDIEEGANIVARISEGLSKARFVALVLSPEFATSDWCKAEWSSILMDDPLNRKGRVLPLRYRDYHLQNRTPIDVPPLLRALRHFDFRDPKEFDKAATRLVARLVGSSSARGRGLDREAFGDFGALRSAPEDAISPEQEPESLISNLLPVRELPGAVFAAPCSLAHKRDVPEVTNPFIVREGSLLAFANPRESPDLALVCDSSRTSQITASEWAHTAKRKWYVELLADTLRCHLAERGIEYDEIHGRYFFAAQGDGTRFVRWGSGDKRWVVRKPDPGKGGYWVHHAARLRFEDLDDRYYLSVEPTMAFTTDGRRAVPRDVAGPLTVRWSGRERNGAVLRHVLMWSDAISRGTRDAILPAGRQHVSIARMPMTVQSPVRLADRVAVGALLQFSKSEVDPNAASTPTFVDNLQDNDEEESTEQAIEE